MGWLSEQIKLRMKNDDEQFESAFALMADVVMDNSNFERGADFQQKDIAINEIMRYYRVKQVEMPENIKGFQEKLEYIFRPAGIMWRTVKLKKGWYKNAIGPMIIIDKQEQIVALTPCATVGYTYTNQETGKQKRVRESVAKELGETAICFYKPLPQKELNIASLLKFMFSTVSVGDVMMIAFATLCTTLIGLLTPYINKLLFGVVIPSSSVQLLLPIAVLFVGVSISTVIIRIFSSLITSRLTTKMSIGIESASMMRLLSLPTGFFKKYTPGELAFRMESVNKACSSLTSAIFTTGFTSLFSLLYVGQIFAYAPTLVLPALCIIIVTMVFSVFSIFVQIKLMRKRMEISAKEEGMVFSLFSGVQKVKLTGSEKRVFSNWAKIYAKVAQLQFRPPWFIRANAAFSAAIGMFGMLIIYWVAGQSGISIADYMAFNVSYGMSMGAFMSLSSIFSTIATIRPSLDMAKPFLQEVPEVSENKKVITQLRGGIELNHVSFRYNEDMPYVIEDMSLVIKKEQYVAIVGKTGCGKSTLIRLLLGFELAERGGIYFDNKDIGTVDLKSLRSKIGTVMQDGKLFSGSVYSNITICAPNANLDLAWEAAEMAGIAEDIRKMPMGMHTVISEGGGGVSGGQMQRLMIARAVASKPRILIFDEATSALDNITQQKVAKALSTLKCTRLVVAHRLSTIRDCDRIIVLDKGKIAEEGTFEELMEQKGMFYELAKRQIAEED